MENERKYEKIINFKKQEFHENGWNALDMNAGQLASMEIAECGGDLEAACHALRACMLEGDCYLNLSSHEIDRNVTVRFFCDNLSPDRRKYEE